MDHYILTESKIGMFINNMILEEKSDATIEKYSRDIKKFFNYIERKDLNKELVIAYKKNLKESNYAIRSINSMLSSINSLFDYLNWNELKVKTYKIQQQIFYPEEKELTKDEYKRLVKAALEKHNERLSLIIQTICATGIRVSELQHITAEAINRGEAIVTCKGKTRTIFIVHNLQKKLLDYVSKEKIVSGSIFVTRNRKPICRNNIWREMKELCIDADVNPSKVFPHNLRHLFARVFYNIERDIAKLADVLGHSNINTTRIYIISTGKEHARYMKKMQMIE